LFPLDIFENDPDNPSAESPEEKQSYERKPHLCGGTKRWIPKVTPESRLVLQRVRKHDVALPTFDVPRQLFGLMLAGHVIEQIIPLAVAVGRLAWLVKNRQSTQNPSMSAIACLQQLTGFAQNTAMKQRLHWQRIVIATLIGCALTAGVTLLQPRLNAGSIPDLFCEVLLLPGKLVAGLFNDRGTASPEFVWRSRVVTAAFLAGVGWLCLHLWQARPASQ